MNWAVGDMNKIVLSTHLGRVGATSIVHPGCVYGFTCTLRFHGARQLCSANGQGFFLILAREDHEASVPPYFLQAEPLLGKLPCGT